MNNNTLQKWLPIAMLWILIFSSSYLQLSAQKPTSFDSSYYQTFDGMLTGRLYMSNKYAAVRFKPTNKNLPTMFYRPNSRITMGVGATYKALTLNLAYGWNFLNNSRSDRGKTKYLDAQGHIYKRKSIVDFYAQSYKGYYLNPIAPENVKYYIRPDMKTLQLGAHYEYITNWRRFSMRSGLLQLERQLKSAGSPFFGFEMHYTKAEADSSLVPTGIPSFAALPGVTRINSFEFGPSVGYGYTLVIGKLFFITATAKAQANLNFAGSTDADGKHHQITLRPDYGYRIAAGINRPKWSFALSWVNQNAGAKAHNYNFQFESGLTRAFLSYRFAPGPRLKPVLDLMDPAEQKKIRQMHRQQKKLHG